MKLIIRTAYWGQVLRGKTLDRVSPGARQSRSISSQAVIKNEGQFWGCCPTQGKRVLEMTERHFLDAYDGDWGTFQQFRTIRSRHCWFLTACIFFSYLNRFVLYRTFRRSRQISADSFVLALSTKSKRGWHHSRYWFLWVEIFWNHPGFSNAWKASRAFTWELLQAKWRTWIPSPSCAHRNSNERSHWSRSTRKKG